MIQNLFNSLTCAVKRHIFVDGNSPADDQVKGYCARCNAPAVNCDLCGMLTALSKSKCTSCVKCEREKRND